jgi:hypothetical protein
MKPILAALMVAFILPVSAETTDQLIYDNPDYSIVLTVKPCSIDKKHYPFNMPFEYEAIAFDKQSSGKACWYRDGEIVHAWYYEEQEIFIGSYRQYLFKPVKPEL